MQTIYPPLPIELVDLILKYAAEPTFAQPERYDAKKPYSVARKLCLVSRGARRAVLPEMLRTVCLNSSDVPAFVHALRMQEEYAQTYPALCFEYTRYIRNIWIGDPEHLSRFFVSLSVPEPDIGLLAPVLLGAPSLATNLSSMDLLTRCVEHAWTHMSRNVDDQRSSPAWGTKTLTLSEVNMEQWDIATRASGSAFLASLTHLIVVPASNRHINDRYSGIIGAKEYTLHRWITHIPWASFERLETISLAFPLVELPVRLFLFMTGTTVRTELLTFPASLMKGRVPLKIKASTETGGDCISLDDVRVVVSDSRVHFCTQRHQWEKVWACGLLTGRVL